ncbi:MAG: hypothetical protein LBD90_09800 [Bifidobacteriaceae bacterium]|jgi:hypothetical protein|nr:hypothetical protein [Bifidobacteriaceae bacterium]
MSALTQAAPARPAIENRLDSLPFGGHPSALALDGALAQLDWAPSPPGAAMISWWGADYEQWSAVDAAGRKLTAKLPRAHVEVLGAHHSRVAARLAAGRAGLGPEVVQADRVTGASVEVDLGPGFRVATLLRIAEGDALSSYLAARAAFRRLPVNLAPRNVFDDIDHLRLEVARRRLEPPAELTPLVRKLAQLRQATAAGPPPAPGWNSSEISNVLIGADGAVQLVGPLLAGMTDPLEDVGVLANELNPYVDESDGVIDQAWGRPHPGVRARAHLYGLADDLRWTLIALVANSLDPTSPTEYGGYAVRRTWRAAAAMSRPGQVERWLAEAEEGWR